MPQARLPPLFDTETTLAPTELPPEANDQVEPEEVRPEVEQLMVSISTMTATDCDEAISKEEAREDGGREFLLIAMRKRRMVAATEEVEAELDEERTEDDLERYLDKISRMGDAECHAAMDKEYGREGGARPDVVEAIQERTWDLDGRK